MARTGRRPGDPDTRGEVLAAARATFASSGYHAATIRAIATRAGVDPALVHHYFGSKEDLFAASVRLPLRPPELVEHVMGDGIDHVGERLARLFFTAWEQQPTRDALLALVRGAMTTDGGAAALREFFGSVMLSRVAPQLDGDDAELRVTLAASQLVGTALLRYVVGFPALADATIDDLVAQLAPRLQTWFTPELLTDGGGSGLSQRV